MLLITQVIYKVSLFGHLYHHGRFRYLVVDSDIFLQDIVILSVARTPIGSFQKSLACLSAVDLGAVAIKSSVERANVDFGSVQECYMGLVNSAGIGQAPARQAALKAGLDKSTPSTTINKVCASGMKSIMIAAQSIALGHQDVICAGGMESMSNVPFYLQRKFPSYGGVKLIDGILHDGLTDAYDNIHMGQCAEKTASDLNICRESQDQYAHMSYERYQNAIKNGIFQKEIAPVQILDKKSPSGFVEMCEDEEYKRVDLTRFSKLKPVFIPSDQGGTITVANASALNDGAAAMILASDKYVKNHNKSIKPLAIILDFADASVNPVDYSIAPHKAILKLLKRNNLNLEDISLWEINEAFALVVLANIKLLNLPIERVNIHGGAVTCGHPIGMSGARITNHLVLALKSGQKGIAAVCNGGGGASAILIERL